MCLWTFYLRDDDIFMNMDADEIPKSEVIRFFKYYDYDGDPFKIVYRHALFGFFLQKSKGGHDDPHVKGVGCTIKFLREMCYNDLIYVRRNVQMKCKKSPPYKVLTVGTKAHYGGYHCSWCFTPEGIRLKMKYAQTDDGPNWLYYPEKVTDENIANMIRKGDFK